VDSSQQDRHIDHEARVAGVVAVAVCLLELSVNEWVHEFYGRSPVWTIVAGLAVILMLFRVVFLAIRSYERRWHAEEKQRRDLELKRKVNLRVGVVDGVWIDAVWDISTRQLVEGSVLKIESSGAGFQVEGWAYASRVMAGDSDLAHVGSCGHFIGRTQHWHEDGFVYTYKGNKGPTQRDDGAVVYEFSSHGAGHVSVCGMFCGFGLKSAYYVEGKRVSDNPTSISAEHHREKQLLRDYLKKLPQELPP
jgi:hypothetical protein